MGKRFWLVNLFSLGAVILIVASFFYPLWSLSAKAVQYETEFPEGLRVFAYLHKLGGEIYELNIMSKWIGAHFPERVPEHVIFPLLFGGVALLCFASIFFNDWKRRILGLALLLFVALAIAGAGSLQWRLYTFGHARDPYPPADIPDFTIPLVGSTRFMNWKITTNLNIGAYAMGLAALLVTLAYVITAWEYRKESAKEGKAP